MPELLRLYHRMPYPLRVAAASARGYLLRWWRYSSRTDELAARALERDTWTNDSWRAWREERLAYVLHRAATRVPYYREYWAARRRGGDRRSWERLENWPVLTKEPLRVNPRAFLSDEVDPRRMYPEHTSGTTGKALHLWWSRETVQQWYALFEARARLWNGVSRHDRWAIVGGQMVAPYSATRPPFWVWNAGLKQLYLSSYHLGVKFIADYIQALRDYNIRYILSYPSSVYSLARLAQENGLQLPQMKVVLTNAEQLYPQQRDWIGHAFQSPVIDTYGMVEIVTAASQCAYRRLHLWPEVGVTEVLAEGADVPLEDGETGRLIGTGLLNTDMPLIRYQVGDRGALLPADTGVCECGRSLPALAAIEGRLDDVVLTPDGRRVGRLGPVFRGQLPVREAQIIQETREALRVLVVPAEGFTPESKTQIVERLHERVGDMHIDLEVVDAIPRSANGKFRVIVSRLPAEQAGEPDGSSPERRSTS